MAEIRERAFDWLKSQGQLTEDHRLVLQLVREWPDSTDAEIARLVWRIHGMPFDVDQVRSAREDLSMMGKVERSGERRCSVTKIVDQTWRIVIQKDLEAHDRQQGLL